MTLKDFEDLFKSQHDVLCAHSANLVRDAQVAKDVVQDVFYKLWSKRSMLSHEDNLPGYLYRATTHASLNYLQSRRYNLTLDETVVKNLAVEEPQSGDVDQLKHAIERAVKNLPPKCRIIFLLSRTENLTYQQIAEQLEVSKKTVENQMGIAFKKLRKELFPYRKLYLLTLIIILLYMLLRNFI